MKSYKRDLPQNTQEHALPALFDPETRFLTISPTRNPTTVQPPFPPPLKSMTTIPNTMTSPILIKSKAKRRKTDTSESSSDQARARRYSGELRTASIVTAACNRFFASRMMKPCNFNGFDSPRNAIPHAQGAAGQAEDDQVEHDTGISNGSATGNPEGRESKA